MKTIVIENEIYLSSFSDILDIESSLTYKNLLNVLDLKYLEELPLNEDNINKLCLYFNNEDNLNLFNSEITGNYSISKPSSLIFHDQEFSKSEIYKLKFYFNYEISEEFQKKIETIKKNLRLQFKRGSFQIKEYVKNESFIAEYSFHSAIEELENNLLKIKENKDIIRYQFKHTKHNEILYNLKMRIKND
jgi:hypothetical protein